MSVKRNKSTDSQDQLTSAEIHRILTGMQDAFTDEMIVRLTDAMSQTLLLFEKLNQAGLDKRLTIQPQIIKLLGYFEQNHLLDEEEDYQDISGVQVDNKPGRWMAKVNITDYTGV